MSDNKRSNNNSSDDGDPSSNTADSGSGKRRRVGIDVRPASIPSSPSWQRTASYPMGASRIEAVGEDNATSMTPELALLLAQTRAPLLPTSPSPSPSANVTNTNNHNGTQLSTNSSLSLSISLPSKPVDHNHH
jgi:hypothetical protein